MKRKQMEQTLRDAVHKSAPDVLGSVLSRCDEPLGEVLDMKTEQVKRKKWLVPVVSSAAALVLMAGALLGFGLYRTGNRVDSVIGFDVNPSIELKINKKERVLEANALNGDAETVLDGMDLEGADLDVAVNAVIGSMLKNGYISELANSVLVSVENDDAKKGAALQQRIAQEVDSLLRASSISHAILSQTVADDDEVVGLMDTYGISQGKAVLIQKLIAQDSRLKAEDLAGLTINELNLLADARGGQLADTSASGNASDKAYIGMDAAKQRAFEAAGIDAAQAARVEVDFDVENGRMVYEV